MSPTYSPVRLIHVNYLLQVSVLIIIFNSKQILIICYERKLSPICIKINHAFPLLPMETNRYHQIILKLKLDFRASIS
jgi:hypothetical protein